MIIDLRNVLCEEVDMGETNAYHFSMLQSTAFPTLSEEEKNILDIVIGKLGKMSKNEIVSFMHKERAYSETAPRDVISFEFTKDLRL